MTDEVTQTPTTPEVVAEITQDQLNEMVANAVPEPAPAAPSISLQDAILNTAHALGAVVDLGSYRILVQRMMEYELTLSQLAICAATGNKPGFEQMVNQLHGVIFQNQVSLITLLRHTLEAKIAIIPKPGREEAMQCAQPTEGTSQCH